jgi:hypothetical protein
MPSDGAAGGERDHRTGGFQEVEQMALFRTWLAVKRRFATPRVAEVLDRVILTCVVRRPRNSTTSPRDFSTYVVDINLSAINQELGEPFRRDAMKKPVVVAGIKREDMRPQKIA